MADNIATKGWVDKKVKESQLKYEEFMKHMEKDFNQHELPIDRHTEALIYSCIGDIQKMSYGSGLVRAPKFGVNHIKN